VTKRPDWASDPSLCIFVNCPFDEDYRDALDAIVFTCVHAGFCPWIAQSTGTVADSRLERILEGLSSCRYSIHDLSRYRGEGSENLSRFNMPLELGMAMGLRGWSRAATAHDWMVMGPVGHQFHQYVSDLSGHDPSVHDGSAAHVSTTVLSWLVARPNSSRSVAPAEVQSRIPTYSRRKRELDEEWRDATPWKRVLELALEVTQS
jgi:hypothetical protein